MTSEDIEKILRRREHGKIVIRELRLGSGYGASERRIDLWAIDVKPSTGCKAIAYEIKISRSDFLRDIKDPIKQRGARMYSDAFFFAAPRGIINPAELPVFAGLIEFDEESSANKYYLGQVTVDPIPRSKERPSWPFVVSLLRRIPEEARGKDSGR